MAGSVCWESAAFILGQSSCALYITAKILKVQQKEKENELVDLLSPIIQSVSQCPTSEQFSSHSIRNVACFAAKNGWRAKCYQVVKRGITKSMKM